MEGPALDVVPEAVLFRGVKEGKSVKRALLVKNTTEDALDVLVTQPLSGVFELVLPESSEGNAEEDEDEPRFFNTIEIPPNETIKVWQDHAYRNAQFCGRAWASGNLAAL